MSPRAAYIHVPFCAHRCGYCNFTLVAGRDDLIEPYLAALQRELAGTVGAGPVDTLYFGGGTPTQLAPSQLARLMEMVLQSFPLAPAGELTVEANPADVDLPRLEVLAGHGATRLSLGAQSFRAAKLALLERDHAPRQIAAALVLARRHVQQVSLDLIFGAPGETLDEWQADLVAAVALQPDHVSTYGLTFERGTQFWSRRRRGELCGVDEELERAMYLAAIERLTASGFEHYEVSNFARPGARCRHNEVYWTGESYHAVGPGAARFVDGRREVNHRSTTTYIRRVLEGQSPVAEREQLGSDDAARERLVFGLRRLAGVDLAEFHRRTGYDAVSLGGAALARHVAEGRLTLDAQRLRLTREGLLVSDAIWPDFLRV